MMDRRKTSPVGVGVWIGAQSMSFPVQTTEWIVSDTRIAAVRLFEFFNFFSCNLEGYAL